MLLGRSDEAQCTVPVFVVVPLDEVVGPGSGFFDGGETARRQRGVVFARAEEGFGVGVVVADARARVRGSDAELVHEGVDGGGFKRAAVVAMQDQGLVFGGDVLGQAGSAQEGLGVGRVFLVPDFGSNDLAAVEVQDDVELVEAPCHGGWQPGDVPAPDLVGGAGYVGGLGSGGFGCPGASAMVLLAGLAQDPVEGGFGGDVGAFFGEFDHDLCRGVGGVVREIALAQDLGAFRLTEGVFRPWVLGPWPAVWAVAVIGLAPALEGAPAQAEGLGALALARSGAHGFVNQAKYSLAIQGAGQASSSPQIASAFFRSTSRAAVSARALSLRRSSASSLRVRARSSRWRRSRWAPSDAA